MKHSGVVALCVLVAALALANCGGEDSSNPVNTPAPTPSPTATPGPFNGNYVGTVMLDAGQTGTVLLKVQNETGSGTLTISGNGMADLVVPLTGLVDQIGGTFSLKGDSDVVSGTLPGPGGTGFLSVQIGTNTTPFHGTIRAA